MSNKVWDKKWFDEPIWEGPRVAESIDYHVLKIETRFKIMVLIEAIEWNQFVKFKYGNSDRIVAPFVVGVSKEGNPLLRGFQMVGNSRSGKGPGWRVFQIEVIEKLENHQTYFEKEDFDFDNYFPWIYRVIKMV
jgi:hypothetical protein